MAKKTKKTVRRPWTKDDVRTMRTMAKAKAGVKKIAKALKRTPGATAVPCGRPAPGAVLAENAAMWR